MDPGSFHYGEEDSVSPLSSFSSPNIPPPSTDHHTGVEKQDFEPLASKTQTKASSETSEHSQSRRFAASPLDKIPSSLYTRFPRFSTTTENSSPDLSAEEVISTRLSIDEHAIIEAPPSSNVPSGSGGKRHRLQAALHRAISTPSLGLRRVRDRLRRIPSSTLSGNTLRQEATSVSEEQSQARVLHGIFTSYTLTTGQCTTDQVSGTDVNSQSFSVKASPEASLKENKVLRLKRSSKEALTRTYSRLSTLTERKPELESPFCQSQQGSLLREPVKHFQPLSSSALKALDDLNDPSVTSFRSYYTAPDHLLRQASGLFPGTSLAAQDSGLPRLRSSRGILPGSLDELRSNSFVAASQRAFSFSGVPPGRSPLFSADQIPRAAPIARPVTLFDVDDVRGLNQLRQDPLFVDMPNGHQTNFIFPPSAEDPSGPVIHRSLRSQKTRSYRSLRQTPSVPLLIRSTSIKQGLESANYRQKIPLYTPAQIITSRGQPVSFSRRVSSLAQADPALETLDGMNDEISVAADRSSSNRLSKASMWSTKEDRAHCQGSKDPSIRSEDPSIKSGDLRPWWKGQKFLAVLKNIVLPRTATETITGSQVPSQTEMETDDCGGPFKRTCGFYARRMKQKLWGSPLQEATENAEGHDAGQ